jgi:hypothetical protein
VDDGLVGDASVQTRIPSFYELLIDPPTLVDILNVVPPTGPDTHQGLVETEKSLRGALACTVRTAGTGGTTPVAVINVTNVEGFYVGQNVYVFTSAGRQGPEVITAITSTAGAEVLTFAAGEIDFDVAVGDVVVSDTYLATGEGETKPARVLEVDMKTINLQTMASYVITTRQRIRNTNVFDMMRWASGRLPRDLKVNLEWNLLYGSGSGGQLNGLLHANNLVNTDTWSSSVSAGDNRADLILWSAAQIPGVGRTYAVLHKNEWQRIIKAKDSTGNYVHGAGEGPAIINTAGLKAIGDVIVITSPKVVDTTGLTIRPEAASEVPSANDAELTVGHVNTQLIQNKQTILYEESWEQLVINALQAYRKLNFDAAPS